MGVLERVGWAALILLISAETSHAEFPKIGRGDIGPNDVRLAAPIDLAKDGELTIASMNVRNWGARRRGFRDYEAIVDIVDEADVIVFQEVALGVFDNDEAISSRESKQLESVVALMRIHLGTGFDLALAPRPSGTGAGAESSILAYRKQVGRLNLAARWKEWVDLGPRRDMAVFELAATDGLNGARTDLLVGSVHLKPKDPFRGEEMNKVADWMVANKDRNAIVLGDFNWGYANSGANGNQGEKRITELHENGTLFQVFKELSYLANRTRDQLRTNMGFRKTPRFYDQILTTPSLAAKMADGGKLLKDCGFVASGVYHRHMIEVRLDLGHKMNYGLDKFLDKYKEVYELGEDIEKMVDDVRRAVTLRADDAATYFVSDHRVVWAQFDLVN